MSAIETKIAEAFSAWEKATEKGREHCDRKRGALSEIDECRVAMLECLEYRQLSIAREAAIESANLACLIAYYEARPDEPVRYELVGCYPWRFIDTKAYHTLTLDKLREKHTKFVEEYEIAMSKAIRRESIVRDAKGRIEELESLLSSEPADDDSPEWKEYEKLKKSIKRKRTR